jgi:hypothetical protein
MPQKAIDHIQIIARLREGKATGKFSHRVYEAHKIPSDEDTESLINSTKYQNLWFLKHVKDLSSALMEVLAQEYFRLITPEQPKTRLVVDDNYGVDFYVLSKKVPGYVSLGAIDPDSKIATGEYRGLGAVLVTSLVMNERDLKISNMGIHSNGTIIKIDGGWCFAKLKDPRFYLKDFQITSADLERLPIVKDYDAFNWLDSIIEGSYKVDNITHEISENAEFRQEVNESIFKNIILPPELVDLFVKSYVEDEEMSYILTAEILDRQEQLKDAALQTKSFKDFLDSAEAEKCLQNYLEYLQNFKTMDNNLLVNPDQQIIVDGKNSETAVPILSIKDKPTYKLVLGALAPLIGSISSSFFGALSKHKPSRTQEISNIDNAISMDVKS